MLGMLFVAASSTDAVKELQDKVISLQDHEVAFLNTTISNMLTAVGIGVAIITAFFSWAYVYVRNSNKQAQDNIAKAEEQMLKANEMIKKAEGKILEADRIAEKAHFISNSAQEKLEELEREQKEVKMSTEILEISMKVDFIIERNKREIDKIVSMLHKLLEGEYHMPVRKEYALELLSTCRDLEKEFSRIKMNTAKGLIKRDDFAKITEDIAKFDSDCKQLRVDFEKFEEEILGHVAQQ
ncbi:spbB protein [Bacillus bombysepticus]